MQGVTNKTYEVAKHYMTEPFYVSSPYGDGRSHRGIDLSIPGEKDNGEPIYSFLDGIVKRKGYQEHGAGYYIVIGQDNGQEQKYMHMKNDSKLNIGDTVKAGDQIGEIGNTGNSTGSHLHFELWNDEGRPVDPLPYLKRWAKGVPKHKSKNKDVYTVEKGDTLSEIAVMFQTDIDTLLKMNEDIKNPNLIYIGQRINVPKNKQKYFKYKVKKGDTLSELAKKYDTSIGEIMRINKEIKNPDIIYIGQVIKIPKK